ncbi:hypothetical protein F2Q69_00006108 [Brassica cretica]|uniref:Uncharacterized protein n=1 Tax=Brassica cretica TaxID=69181 RepID=A0A8S9P3D1_BRACR|nr:hypothetical protein F2Q69_00006108 [Brassica cretica]
MRWKSPSGCVDMSGIAGMVEVLVMAAPVEVLQLAAFRALDRSTRVIEVCKVWDGVSFPLPWPRVSVVNWGWRGELHWCCQCQISSLFSVLSSATKVHNREHEIIPRQDSGLWVPLGDAPGPRQKIFWVRSQGPPPSSRKRKTSDKENLAYFRIWKSSTRSNRLRPTSQQLYKGNLNSRARDRHFKT